MMHHQLLTKPRFIEQERKKRKMNSVALNKTALHLQSLYFDGRKDQTITQKLINRRMHKRTVVEEHITLIKESQSEYIGHFCSIYWFKPIPI